MGLSWYQYTFLYYGLQWALFFFIYIFLIIFIPYDLMGWNLKTLFSMDPLHNNEKENNGPKKQSGTDRHCFICKKIWNWFGNFFTRNRQPCCKACTCCGSDTLSDDWNSPARNAPFECCVAWSDLWKNVKECRNLGEGYDLKDRKLPHDHKLDLEKNNEKWYCGCINLNLNRICIYLLLCACMWCASVAFFESIILGYSAVSNGDSCPIPKEATDATVVDCFIFKNTLDPSPINTSFPTQCNGTVALSFTGVRADCFAWIYAQVEVVAVIEELGICAGIVALLGTVVAVISFLCQHHRWRLLCDITACLAAAAIPILVYRDGSVPFLTYILLGSLSGAIIITEYLLGYVPLLTWLCVASKICGCIKDNQSEVTLFQRSSA